MNAELETLVNSIIEEYRKRVSDTKLLENFLKAGAKGSFTDVYDLAKAAGLNLETSIINQWNFDGEVYYQILKDVLTQTTVPMNQDIATAFKTVQSAKNKQWGITLKPQTAAVNQYDIDDIATRMKNKGISQLSGELQTLGCKIVDDDEKANMDLLSNAGYKITVTRKYDGIGLRKNTKYSERCAFCLKLVGTHQFKSTREASASGVFKRHAGCGCTIDYSSGGGTSQRVNNYHKATATAKKQKTSRVEEVSQNIIELGRRESVIELSTRYLNKADEIYEAAKFIEPLDGYEDIFCHGDEYGLIFRDAKNKESSVSAAEFCELLKMNPHYKGGNIRLIACKTGAEPAVAPKYIAKELGVEVLAPTNTVYLISDKIGEKVVGARMILANDKKDAIMGIESGEWILFSPKGK